MKKVGLFLLAVVMVAGCGGSGGDDDFTPTLSNMAGLYNVVKYTYMEGGTTVVLSPPDYLDTLELTPSGDYRRKATYRGELVINTSGTFSVSDSTIIFVNSATGRTVTGIVSDEGRKIRISGVEGGKTYVLTYTRS